MKKINSRFTYILLMIVSAVLVVIISYIYSSTLIPKLVGNADVVDTKLKIGVILPLSGSAGKMGEEVLQSIQMANLSTIELAVEDDQCSPKNALSAYEKMNAQGIDVFYIACSGSVMSVYPKAKENNDVILTAYAGSVEIRKTDDTVIRFIPDGLSIASEMSAYINEGVKQNNINLNKVMVVYENSDYSKSVADTILEKVLGIKLVDTYKSDDVDFKSLALRLKQSGANTFVFIPTSDKAFKLFLQELKKNTVVGTVIGDVNVCDYQFSTSEFNLPATCWKSKLSDSLTASYENQYKTKWGTASNYTFYNAVTTDIFEYLNARGVNKSNSIAEAIQEDLLKSGYKGLYGNYEFTPDGEIADYEDYLVRVTR